MLGDTNFQTNNLTTNGAISYLNITIGNKEYQVALTGNAGGLVIVNWSNAGGTFTANTENHISDTSSYTYTLPTSPLDGAKVVVIDALNNFFTYNQTINRNGTTTIIGEDAQLYTSYVCRNSGGMYIFTYQSASTTWILQTNIMNQPVVDWATNTAGTMLANTTNHIFNTSAQTYTLPTTPFDGTIVKFSDSNNNFATYNQVVSAGGTGTISFNGYSSTTTFNCTANNGFYQFEYQSQDNTWTVISNQQQATTQSQVSLYLDSAGGSYVSTPISGTIIPAPVTTTQTTITTGSRTNTNNVQVATFLLNANTLPSTTIAGGTWYVNTYAQANNTTVSYYWVLSYVQSNGTSGKTQIASSSATPTAITVGSTTLTTNLITVPQTTLPDSTYRIVLDLYCNFAGTSRSATFYYRSTTVPYVYTTFIPSSQYSWSSVGEGSTGYLPATGNAFFGVAAGYQNTGSYNVGVGLLSLYNNSGTGNTAVGYNTLPNSTTGYYNTAIGYNAASTLTSSTGNTIVGANSYQQGTGSANTIVGAYAGYSMTGGNYNTVVGFNAASGLQSGTGNIILGANATPNVSTGSYQLVIGDSNFGQGNLSYTGISTTYFPYLNIQVGNTGYQNRLSNFAPIGQIFAYVDRVQGTTTASLSATKFYTTPYSLIVVGAQYFGGLAGPDTIGTYYTNFTAPLPGSYTVTVGSYICGNATANAQFTITRGGSTIVYNQSKTPNTDPGVCGIAFITSFWNGWQAGDVLTIQTNDHTGGAYPSSLTDTTTSRCGSLTILYNG